MVANGLSRKSSKSARAMPTIQATPRREIRMVGKPGSFGSRPNGDWPSKNRPGGLATEKRCATRIGCGLAHLFLDLQEPIVLRHPLRPRWCSGLDLAGTRGDGEVGDERVLGFARAMRDHAPVSGAAGGGDRLQGLGQSADLIDLDQDAVCHPGL